MKRGMYVMVMLMLFLSACSGDKKEGKVAKEEKPKSEVTETEPEEETQVEEEIIPFLPEIEMNSRNITLMENEKGSITYMGDVIDESGVFHAALKYVGDATYSDYGSLYFRFIFDDGSDLFMSLHDTKRHFFSGSDEIRVMSYDETISSERILKRIDYSLVPDEEYDQMNEEKKQSIVIEETTEKVTIDPVLAFDTLQYSINEVHEDDEKTIKLNTLSMEQTEGKVRVDGEITFKNDTFEKVYGKLYRPINGTITEGYSDTEQDFFSGIPVAFFVEYTTDQLFGKDDSSLVHLEVMDSMFSFDLATGKSVQTPLVLTHRLSTEGHEFMDTVPTEGLKTNQGELVYNVLSFREPYWNYGEGTTEKATHPFIIGGKFNTFTFTLASGEEFAGNGGVYDVYIYGDDYESVQDSDEIKGKVLFHHQFKGTDKPQDFEVNVEGVNTLHIYYNSNRDSANREDPDEQLIQLMMINPTLE